MGSVDSLVRVLRPTASGVVRLGGVDFVEPAHLVGVAAYAEAARRADGPFALEAPRSGGTARFACRMRLGSNLARLGFEDPLGRVRERPLRTELLEVSALGGGTAAALAELVAEKVRGPHGDAVAHALHQSTSEIGQNAEAYAGITGYAAAVTFPRSGELLVAVGDAGVGTAATLGRSVPLTDAEALRLAVQGATSRPGSAGGSGVRLTLEAVRGLGGQCFLVTGGAVVSVADGREGRPRALSHTFPGTLFQARIPLGRPGRPA